MAHADILDRRESLGVPLAGSVMLHAAVVASLAGYGWVMSRPADSFGDPNSLGGGSVEITPVSRIPLPPRAGVVNPVANDTESRVPTPPAKEREAEKARDDREAIALKTKRRLKRQAEVAASNLKYRNPVQDKPNQVYSSSGQAAVSPMYGSTAGGSGNVGFGGGNPFGNRFGYYAQLIRDRVARMWAYPPQAKGSQPVIVTFEIQRNGQIRSVKLLQRSGNYELDMSAQRAIMQAAPFDPLPAGYERDSASIEFWFVLKQ
jgi:protein TonB